MVKCFAFDAMGVVFEEGHIVSNILCKWKEIKRECTYIKEQYMKYAEGKMSREEFWSSLGVERERIEEVERRYLERIKLNKEIKGILKKLKGKYKIALVSHIPAKWINDLLEREEIKEYFDVILITEELKTDKSHPYIYELLIKRVKEKPEEIVFIDDNPKNVEVASRLGIRGMVYEGKETLKQLL